jgi:hypothetical protein
MGTAVTEATGGGQTVRASKECCIELGTRTFSLANTPSFPLAEFFMLGAPKVWQERATDYRLPQADDGAAYDIKILSKHLKSIEHREPDFS